MRHSLKGQERDKHEVLPTKNRHSTTFDADPNSAISPKYKIFTFRRFQNDNFKTKK